MYRLIIEEPDGRKRSLAVQEGTVTLGRDPSCDVRIADDEVSWKHAIIEKGPAGISIRDMGSLNKITVNGRDVREAVLANGDNVELGRTKIRFQDARGQALTGPLKPAGRRVNLLHRLTLISVALVLLGELVVVSALFIWRHTGGDELLKAQTFEVLEPAAAGDKTEPALQIAAVPEETPADKKPEPEKVEIAETKPEPVPDRLTEEEMAIPPPETAPLVEKPEEKQIEAEPEPQPEPDKQVKLEEKAAPEPTPDPIPEPVKEKPAKKEKPAPKEPVKEENPAADDPLIGLARDMLKEARADIQKMNYVEADSRLDRIEIVAPDFLPAYEERAKLYESRGMLQQAGEQWAEIMKRAEGKPEYAAAAAERSRIAQKTAEPGVITVPRRIAALSEPERPLPKRIIIQSVNEDEFGPGPEFDEMRILRIRMRAKASEKNIEGGSVAVSVNFYEKDSRTREIRPAAAYVPGSIPMRKGNWATDGIYEAIASYMASRALGETGENAAYYGYAVRVFYEDVLQDEEFYPADLKDHLAGN